MSMKIGPDANRAAQLRSKAQEELDAAGGEKIAAQAAKKSAGVEQARYKDLHESGGALMAEAKKLRLDAAEKLKGAVGPRGLFALENVARGLDKLLKLASGGRLGVVTTEQLKQDPDARKTAKQMESLAASKEAEAQQKLAAAQKSWVRSTELLAKAGTHDEAAAAHTAAAAKFMRHAKGAEIYARSAEVIGGAVKSGLSALGGAVMDVAKEELKHFKGQAEQELKKVAADVQQQGRGALHELLMVGVSFLNAAADRFFSWLDSKLPAPPVRDSAKKTTPPKAEPPAQPPAAAEVSTAINNAEPFVPPAEKKQLAEAGLYEPGKVTFGPAAGPRPDVKLPAGPDITDGVGKSESFQASRWAAEAVGIDWQGKGAGELKKMLAAHKGGLKLSNGASPFEVKKRIAERLGLPTNKDAVHGLSIDVVRELFARREAIGLSRLAPRTEFEAALAKAKLTSTSPLDQLAMHGVAKSAQDVKDAAAALKADLQSVDKQRAFETASERLDAAKALMVLVVSQLPVGDRHVLALDTADAIELAHGKTGATTKLGAALSSVTQNDALVSHLSKKLGLDKSAFGDVANTALKASEWISLGEVVAPSSVLAYPGPLTDEQRKTVIGPLAKNGTIVAKKLGLVDDASAEALDKHMTFAAGAPPAAQLLGFVRQLAALSERRDFRTKELLSQDDIVLEMLRNAGVAPMIGRDGKPFMKQPPSINPALVDGMGAVIGDLLKAIRGG